jgi:hypothetical protein
LRLDQGRRHSREGSQDWNVRGDRVVLVHSLTPAVKLVRPDAPTSWKGLEAADSSEDIELLWVVAVGILHNLLAGPSCYSPAGFALTGPACGTCDEAWVVGVVDEFLVRVPSMKPLVSSPNCHFLLPRWFARTLHVRPKGIVFCCLVVLFAHDLPKGTFFVALPTGGFTAGTPARYGDGRRRPSIPVGLLAEAPESVFAHWRSVEAWYRDGPSLLRWRLRTPGTSVRPPGPVLDATKPSFPRIARDLFQPAGSKPCILVCLAKRSPALQACNRMRNSQADGVPRGTGLRRSNHASGVFCSSRSPEFMPRKRTGIPRERSSSRPG